MRFSVLSSWLFSWRESSTKSVQTALTVQVAFVPAPPGHAAGVLAGSLAAHFPSSVMTELIFFKKDRDLRRRVSQPLSNWSSIWHTHFLLFLGILILCYTL